MFGGLWLAPVLCQAAGDGSLGALGGLKDRGLCHRGTLLKACRGVVPKTDPEALRPRPEQGLLVNEGQRDEARELRH